MPSVKTTSDKSKAKTHEDKLEGLVSSDDHRRHGNRKLLYIVAIVIILVVPFSILMVHEYDLHKTPAKTPQQMAADGDYKGAQKAILNQANAATSPAAKAQVYEQASQIANESSQPADAVTYAKTASNLQPSVANFVSLGFAAENAGDWQTAANAFAQAVKMTPVPKDGDQYSDYYYYLGQQKDAESHL